MPTHTITVPDWHPTRLNALVGGHFGTRSRKKRGDRDMVAGYALVAGVPKATGKRRVTLTITLSPRQRAGDPDAYWKSLLDALVGAGLLLDDNRQGVELGPVSFARGDRRATTITLEDLAPAGGIGARTEPDIDEHLKGHLDKPHAYLDKLRELIRLTPDRVRVGPIHNVVVEHDIGCALFREHACDCDADVYLINTPPEPR